MSLADSLAAKLREAAARGELPVSENRIYSARPDAALAAFEQMRADAELGAAWREAEAVLPDDPEWDGLSVYHYSMPPEHVAAYGSYGAKVSPPGDTGTSGIYAYGPTPAAALRALTVKLQEART